MSRSERAISRQDARRASARFIVCLGLALAFVAAAIPVLVSGQESRNAAPPIPPPRMVREALTMSERYAALEDVDQADVRGWIAQEVEASARLLASAPARGWFRARFAALTTRVSYSSPERQLNDFVFTSTDEAGRASIGLDPAPHAAMPRFVVSDSADGLVRALQISPDGRRVAYARAMRGAATQTWRIHDLESRADLADAVVDARASSAIAWSADARHLLYVRAGESDAIVRWTPRFARADASPTSTRASASASSFASVSAAAADAAADAVVIFTHPRTPRLSLMRTGDEPDAGIVVLGGDDGRRHGWAWHLQDQAKRGARLIASVSPSQLTFVARDGERFLFMTDHETPRARLVAMLPGEAAGRWQTRIASAAPDETLEQVVRMGDRHAARWLLPGRRVVRLHARDGRVEREIALPGIGTVSALRAATPDDLYFEFSSYLVPTGVYHYDVASDRLRLVRAPAVPFDGAAYETLPIAIDPARSRSISNSAGSANSANGPNGTNGANVVNSVNGTNSAQTGDPRVDARDAAMRTPSPSGALTPQPSLTISMTARRGAARDSESPLLVYVNGFRGVPATPAFAFTLAGWLDAGGRVAVLNLPPAGVRTHERDIEEIAALLRALTRDGLATPARLVVHGGGAHGGLLVAAALLRDPTLAAASWTASGPMDLLALDRHASVPSWADEYGDLATDHGRARRRALSPLEAISARTNAHDASRDTSPGTGDWSSHLWTMDDPSIPIWQGYKFTAALNASRDRRVAVIRPRDESGRDAMEKMLDERADVYGFFAARLHWRLVEGEAPDATRER